MTPSTRVCPKCGVTAPGHKTCPGCGSVMSGELAGNPRTERVSEPSSPDSHAAHLCPRCLSPAGESRWCGTCGRDATPDEPRPPTAESDFASKSEARWLAANPDRAQVTLAEHIRRERKAALARAPKGPTPAELNRRSSDAFEGCPRCLSPAGESRWCGTCGRDSTPDEPRPPTAESYSASKCETRWLAANPDRAQAALAEHLRRERKAALARAPKGPTPAELNRRSSEAFEGGLRTTRRLLRLGIDPPLPVSDDDDE
jgi:hypothetical protein